MAVDYGIRVVMDESVITSAEVPKILDRILRILDADSPVITFAAAYAAGTRTYNATINVGTVTSADVAYEILVDAAKSNDFKSELLRRILHVLSDKTLALAALNTTYATGSSSTNQVTLTIS